MFPRCLYTRWSNENKHPSEFLLLLQLHPCSYLANPLHIFFRTRKKTWNSHFQEWLEGNIALYSTFYPNVYPSVWHCKRYSIQFGEWKGTLKYCSPHARKKSFPSVNILRAGSPHSQPPTKVLHQSWVLLVTAVKIVFFFFFNYPKCLYIVNVILVQEFSVWLFP